MSESSLTSEERVLPRWGGGGGGARGAGGGGAGWLGESGECPGGGGAGGRRGESMGDEAKVRAMLGGVSGHTKGLNTVLRTTGSPGRAHSRGVTW